MFTAVLFGSDMENFNKYFHKVVTINFTHVETSFYKTTVFYSFTAQLL